MLALSRSPTSEFLFQIWEFLTGLLDGTTSRGKLMSYDDCDHLLYIELIREWCEPRVRKSPLQFLSLFNILRTKYYITFMNPICNSVSTL